MKHRFLLWSAGVLMLVGMAFGCSSCSDSVEQAAGSYSYKISGSATVNGSEVTLSEEIGAMDIIRKNASTALVTFNAFNGPAYTTEAEIHGDTITLKAYERDITVRTRDYHVTASGTGTIYSNTIVIRLRYKGDEVTANQLTMLCKKN